MDRSRLTRRRSFAVTRTPPTSSTGIESGTCSSARRSYHRRGRRARPTGSSMGRSSIRTGSTGSTGPEATREYVFRVPDPLGDHANLAAALRLAAREAEAFLAGIDEDLVRAPGASDDSTSSLPVDGVGSLAALSELVWLPIARRRAPPDR